MWYTVLRCLTNVDTQYGENFFMNKFTLSTDSTCDLYHDFIVENDIKFVSLTFMIEQDGKIEDHLDNFTEYRQYVEFYNTLRSGALSRTSMLNYESHYEHFLSMAKEGAEDVVHFTISSGLSPTKTVAAKAAADVKALYPKFNVYVVDPLTATVGQGALVRIALEDRNAGKTAEETYEHVNSLRLHIQHFIVADDLSYLQRGGRVSKVSAVVGGVLSIKPILTFDSEGKLFVLDKARGMRKAISYIKAHMEQLPPDEHHAVYVVHTDNEPAANELAEYIRNTFGFEPHVCIMGPVIGSHVGPNAVACGYISSKNRNEF